MISVNGNTQISIIDGDTVHVLPDERSHGDERASIRSYKVAKHPEILLPTTSPASPRPVSSPNLRAMIARWRTGKEGLNNGTVKKLDSHVKTVERYLNLDQPVSAYKPQDIRDAVGRARGHLKGQTINESLLRLLRNAFDLAVEEKLIDDNPAKRLKLEKIAPIDRKQFQWTDALRVLETVKARAEESHLILKAMLFFGIGQAECKSLMGGSIDWKKRKIHFIRKKTGEPYDVPIYPWTEEFIRSLEPRMRPGQPVFQWRNPRKALATACRTCGLETVEIRSLRRTLIIHLLEQGVEPRMVASWQGHKDATLVLKVYGKHINAAHEKAQLEKLK